METESMAAGLMIPTLLIVSTVVIALASLLLHLLFPPTRNNPLK